MKTNQSTRRISSKWSWPIKQEVEFEEDPAGHGADRTDQRTITAAQAQLKESGSAFREEGGVGREGSGVLAAELAELEKEAGTIVRQVEKGLFARYSKLKAMRKEPALVLVKDGICVGCRLQLPPQLISQVKRGRCTRARIAIECLLGRVSPGLVEKSAHAA